MLNRCAIICCFLAIAGLFVTSGSALSCYSCNTTHFGSLCSDPFNPEKAEGHLIECDEGRNETCRKVWQEVDEDLRIFRYCAQEKHPKYNCYTVVSFQYKLTVCQCDEDGCNTASLPTVNPVIAAVFAIITLTLNIAR